MIARGLIKRSILGVCVAVSLAGFASAPSASALSPWWHLTAGSRPSYLQAGVAKDEVQELTVSATAGEVFLAEPKRFNEVFVAGTRSFEELLYAIVPYNATAQQLQEAIATSLYPSRKVIVSEAPAKEENSRTYVITFPGQSVEPIFANGDFVAYIFGRPPLSCNGATGACRGEASVSAVSKGRPDGQIVFTAANLGDSTASGETRIVAGLPTGLEAVSVSELGREAGTEEEHRGEYEGPVSCSLGSLSCVFAGGELPPYHEIEVSVGVIVKGATTGETAQASVTGGGAPGASVTHTIAISGEPVPFGVEEYALAPEEEGGAPDTQAGSHPFQLTTTLTLNQVIEANPKKGEVPEPAQLAKDLHFRLPPGLIGNPTPFPQCTLKDFLALKLEGQAIVDACSPQTAIGVARVTINEPHYLGLKTLLEPLLNLEPSVGEPARFGFIVAGVPVFLDASVRTGGDYGVTVDVNNINQTAGFLKNEVTFWGVPGDPRHDYQRSWACINAALGVTGHGPCIIPTEPHNPPPLLVLPTSCTGPLHTEVDADSWLHAGSFLSFGSDPMPALDGCNRLPFAASIGVAPDGQAASTPTGLTVGIHVPQEEALNANGLSPSEVRDTTVTLPAGVALNPAAGDGLQACTDVPEPGRPEGQIALNSPVGASCPDASKVGTVEVKSPLLPNALVGAVYLAAQNANPFGSLVAMYMVFEDPVSGTLIKLAGEVKPDPVSGQLVSTFLNTPQLPFEDLKLHFFGGSRAPLGTPALCGSYTTVASMAPWSGNAPIEPSSTFQITSGPNNSPCADPLPFDPSLTAGSTNIQAGAFSPFTMTMSRGDGNQDLQAVRLRMPPGLLGTLASVKLCPEPQADLGTCGPESLIGHTIVSVGLGGDPYSVRGGEVFITGPYEGAPYGLSIVNPAKAGPYDLGKVVVRAKIEVDLITAALTVTTDTSGPFAIPHILDGIPLQIQHVNVSIDRPGFTFNPTNCSPLAITGSLTSVQGATKTLSVPFQITNCAVLAFKPKLTAHTAGKTSRANGASLSVKLTYPAGAYDANIAKVKVDLPKQLPSKLPTLQKACPAATFEANPADCPPVSIVGHAKASTPVLPVGLTGPAYFVSHGGEAFPDLIIVLQGYGTTVHIVGSTFINEKTGVTSSTFKTVPDVPVGTFELTLPQGKYSALAATANLCTTKLAMPTSFVAQNGASIHTNTPITPTGCTKHKQAKKANKHHKANKHKK
jgi:hypothetical protein